MMLGVWSLAFTLRFLHNQALLADPLYFNPLGGNLPYLLMGQEIAEGNLLPSDGAFTVNSPLYPYFLAVMYRIFGVGAFYPIRLVTSALDAGTCVVVALLAEGYGGRIAGWAGGVALAVFGPMIFFATDLTPVPLTLFLLSLALLLLDGRGSLPRFAAAGLLLGIATGTRPNVLVAGVLALAVPFTRGLRHPRRLALGIAAGLALGIAPVTVANALSSGRVVLLTQSAGHNFYIGHNPEARAQYSLPGPLDGDIFESMKGLAEDVEGRPFEDSEVSGYYLRRGLGHVVSAPARELQLLGTRALMLVNDFEATTYSSYDYQKSYSAVLRWAPSLALLLLLAAPGAMTLVGRDRAHLWIPAITAAVSVLGFFYIARLRVVLVPSLGIFAGVAVAAVVRLVRDRSWPPLGQAAVVGVAALVVSLLPLLPRDTSNEWNKAGGVLMRDGRTEDAERAFERAREANPGNPNTYLNLGVLYRSVGRSDEADAVEAFAGAILAGEAAEGEAFRRALER
jgi:hypothetical protein